MTATDRSGRRAESSTSGRCGSRSSACRALCCPIQPAMAVSISRGGPTGADPRHRSRADRLGRRAVAPDRARRDPARRRGARRDLARPDPTRLHERQRRRLVRLPARQRAHRPRCPTTQHGDARAGAGRDRQPRPRSRARRRPDRLLRNTARVAAGRGHGTRRDVIGRHRHEWRRHTGRLVRADRALHHQDLRHASRNRHQSQHGDVGLDQPARCSVAPDPVAADPAAADRPVGGTVASDPAAPDRHRGVAVASDPAAPDLPRLHAVASDPAAPDRHPGFAVASDPVASDPADLDAVAADPVAPDQPRFLAVAPDPAAPDRQPVEPSSTARASPSAPARRRLSAMFRRPR